jgi:large subunit ribosomal protein L4
MSVATFTKTGSKATTAAKLDKKVFGLDVDNHELLKQAYQTYLANGRENHAVTKKRGEVSGGGRKPWKQKGTGRARFGSSRNPIWRGGGIAFGPTGNENYSKDLSTQMKRQALRQALSVSKDNVKVIESFAETAKKTADVAKLLNKIEAKGRIVAVVENNDEKIMRVCNNIPNLQVVSAKYLNVFDVLNADTIIISDRALAVVQEWLGGTK